MNPRHLLRGFTKSRRSLPSLILISALLMASCATPVQVSRVDPQSAHRDLTRNVLSSGRLSGFTENVLYRQGLAGASGKDPESTLNRLHRAIASGGGNDELFAAAELSFQHAERSGKKPYYLASALYAYAFLFPDDPKDWPEAFDPRCRISCDLYNRAINAAFASSGGSRVELTSGTRELPFGTLCVDVDPAKFKWAGRQLTEFLPAAELKVYGLNNPYRHPGIGAPLAAGVRSLIANEGFQVSFVAPRVKVPVTAFLRVENPRRQIREGNLHASLELHVTFGPATVTIGKRRVPLETEPSTALAYTLSDTGIWKMELGGFLRGDFLKPPETRLRAMYPYRPGRIPVVFIHGTASSPGRWANMVNELENNPGIRDRFQFWFFTYNTGNPIAFSARVLRQSLQEAVANLDPDGKDLALRRMILIGHSQGGLLAKMTVTDSGDLFWKNISRRPLEELHLEPKTKATLRAALFFHPLPFVRRVVFIATPHKGSFVAAKWFSSLARRIMRAPADMIAMAADAAKGDTDSWLLMSRRSLPTSLDNMTPTHPFIRTLSSIPVARGVAVHSIVAVKGGGPAHNENDGVVTYQSAHLPTADSELVVRSGHSCQSNPETIAEVTRILLLEVAAR